MKHRAFGIAFLPLFVTALAFAQSDSIQRGVDYFHRGDYRNALLQFQQAQRSRPADAVLENLIGIAETQLGQTEVANRDYRRAIELNPRLPEPHKNLAFNLIEAGQYDQALQQLHAAAALDSDDPTIRYYLVLAGLGLHRDADVASNLPAAEPLLATDPGTALLAIQACLRIGETARARDVAALLDQQARFSADQEEQLAKSFAEKGLYSDAAARYRSLSQMHPDAWEIRYDLAITLAQAHQTDEASSLLTALAAQHQKDAAILQRVASAAEFAGNYALAVRTYQDAIAANPADSNAYLECTRLLMDQERYDDAAAIIQQGAGRVSDPYPLTVRLGAIHMMKGNLSAAEASYRSAIHEHPEIALGYVALAQIYIRNGDDATALTILEDGHAHVSADFALEYVRGLELSRTGHQQEAIAALTHAIQLNPQVIEPHYQLGIIHLESGHLPDAQQEFETVLRLNPSHAASAFQLSRVYARMGDHERAQQMALRSRDLTKAEQDAAIREEKSRAASFKPQ